MLLTGALIAGGTLYAGAKIYREKQKKKQKPWIFSAKKLSLTQREKKHFSLTTNRYASGLDKIRSNAVLSSLLVSTKDSLQNLCFDGLSVSFGEERNQQIKELSSSENEIEIREAEKNTNKNLTISLTSLGFAIAGSLVYAPLSLISAAGLVYVSLFFFHGSYIALFKKREINISVVDTQGKRI